MQPRKDYWICDLCNRHTAVVLACIQISVFLLIVFFGNIKYEVSDDFIMEMILSGGYTGKNDIHIMFSNVLWAYILLPLYKIFPRISWYLFGQLSVCLISYIAISYVISLRMRGSIAVLTTVILTAFTAKDLYILPQFTKTATVAIVAGSVLFLHFAFWGRSYKWMTAGALLVLIGSWIRFQSLYIAAPFVAVMFVLELLQIWKNNQAVLKKVLKRCFVTGGPLLIALLGSLVLDELSYAQEDYRYYREYNAARSIIVDYPIPEYADCTSELEAINISENDYKMIVNWSFGDAEVFSLEQMQEVGKVLITYRQKNPISLKSVVSKFLFRQIWLPGAYCCILLGMYCIINDYRCMWRVILTASCVLCLFGYFTLVGRTVYRVEFGCYFCAAVALLFCCMGDFSHSGRKNGKWIFIVAIFIVCFQIPDYIPDKSYQQLSEDNYRKYVDEVFYWSWDYLPEKYSRVVIPGQIRPNFFQEIYGNPDKLYILDFNTAIQTLYYDFSPFQSLAYTWPKNLLYLGGVTVHHPSVVDTFTGQNTGDVLKRLTEENVFFVSNYTEDIVLAYLTEHISADTQMEWVSVIDGYNIWKYTVAGK